ncbi:MAG: DUF3592 domain-containing protein [Ruminococcus flavefaciens]|nr:DUF3592 domain-containing protein [Ruminococcus flavefaciens]MCM1360891.1 DUF3592 domain-containing protein [Clostridiales bacterium]MCM1435567.1 DUF3592 domain-containing protein [Ruminococcus flavefaciens]
MRKTIYRTNDPKIVGIFFILFSIVFIIVGIVVLMIPKIKAQKCTESVRAEVVENLLVESSHRSSSGHRRTSMMYKPVFLFTYNGKDYRVESKTSSDPPAFQPGEIVELKINPDDPTDFYAPSDKTTSFIGIIFTAMGALFLIIGIVLRVVLRKNEESENQ